VAKIHPERNRKLIFKIYMFFCDLSERKPDQIGGSGRIGVLIALKIKKRLVQVS
jgi:hypothetical protein